MKVVGVSCCVAVIPEGEKCRNSCCLHRSLPSLVLRMVVEAAGVMKEKKKKKVKESQQNAQMCPQEFYFHPPTCRCVPDFNYGFLRTSL